MQRKVTDTGGFTLDPATSLLFQLLCQKPSERSSTRAVPYYSNNAAEERGSWHVDSGSGHVVQRTVSCGAGCSLEPRLSSCLRGYLGNAVEESADAASQKACYWPFGIPENKVMRWARRKMVCAGCLSPSRRSRNTPGRKSPKNGRELSYFPRSSRVIGDVAFQPELYPMRPNSVDPRSGQQNTESSVNSNFLEWALVLRVAI